MIDTTIKETKEVNKIRRTWIIEDIENIDFMINKLKERRKCCEKLIKKFEAEMKV